MAATSTMVGYAFLSAPIQTMVDKLTSAEFQDDVNNMKLNHSLLTQLRTTLLTLWPVLDDAEMKQMRDLAVREWLNELKDAIYDAEDLLNQISYDSQQCKVTNQVWNFISSPFNTNGHINSQINNACERLQSFAQLIEIFNLQTVSWKVLTPPPTASLLDQSFTVGRKDDKDELVNILISDTDNNNVGVVAITGMGGLGKTTLAQLIYNQEEVKNHFDVKAWTCVSDDFDILKVTKSLLEAVTLRAWNSNNLDLLQVELKQNLNDKRFLIVLDDICNEGYNDWDELITPFVGKSGSKVIITTRSQRVAEVAHAFHIHKLGRLSDEDSWHLFSKYAFGTENFHGNEYPTLEEIGRRIAIKCGGLPLAARALGGLLRGSVDAEHWNTILNSDTWELPNYDAMPALRLSYLYLPSHLKRCFAYCSIFPKDYQLDRKQLVLLWMAEGFVEHSPGTKEAEEIGDEFFAELISRSLIQRAYDDTDGEKFVMHDLISDLAAIVSGTSCCWLEYGGHISKNVRYLSYNREKHDISRKCEIFHDFKVLRSFLPIGPLWGQNCLPRQVVVDLLPTLIRLRVLSLSKYRNFTKLPDSLDTLTQLRYLDLSNTKVCLVQYVTYTICKP